MENAKNLDHSRHEKVKSISHALGVLNDAASDSSDQIREMVNKDYKRVRSILSDLTPGMRVALHEMKDASAESIVRMKDTVVDSTKDAIKKVDTSAHEKPWAFIGGAAAIAGIFGFALGRRIFKQ